MCIYIYVKYGTICPGLSGPLKLVRFTGASLRATTRMLKWCQVPSTTPRAFLLLLASPPCGRPGDFHRQGAVAPGCPVTNVLTLC